MKIWPIRCASVIDATVRTAQLIGAVGVGVGETGVGVAGMGVGDGVGVGDPLAVGEAPRIGETVDVAVGELEADGVAVDNAGAAIGGADATQPPTMKATNASVAILVTTASTPHRGETCKGIALLGRSLRLRRRLSGSEATTDQ